MATLFPTVRTCLSTVPLLPLLEATFPLHRVVRWPHLLASRVTLLWPVLYVVLRCVTAVATPLTSALVLSSSNVRNADPHLLARRRNLPHPVIRVRTLVATVPTFLALFVRNVARLVLCRWPSLAMPLVTVALPLRTVHERVPTRLRGAVKSTSRISRRTLSLKPVVVAIVRPTLPWYEASRVLSPLTVLRELPFRTPLSLARRCVILLCSPTIPLQLVRIVKVTAATIHNPPKVPSLNTRLLAILINPLLQYIWSPLPRTTMRP